MIYSHLLAIGYMLLTGTAAPLSAHPLWNMWAHTLSVDTVALSPDGTTVASASSHDPTSGDLDHNAVNTTTGVVKPTVMDSRIRLWDEQDGRLRRMLDAAPGWVDSLAFSHDGRFLVSGSGTGTVRLWRVADGRLLRRWTAQSGRVCAVAFSPDGRTIVTGDGVPDAIADHSVRLWQASTGRLLHVIAGPKWGVEAVAIAPDGRELAVLGNSDPVVHRWRLPGLAPLSPLTSPAGSVGFPSAISLAFSPNSSILAAGFYGHRGVCLWHLPDGCLLKTLATDRMGRTRGLSFAGDGHTLFSMGGDNNLRAWRVADGKPIGVVNVGHVLSAIAFSPDGRFYAFGDGEYLYAGRIAQKGRASVHLAGSAQ